MKNDESGFLGNLSFTFVRTVTILKKWVELFFKIREKVINIALTGGKKRQNNYLNKGNSTHLKTKICKLLLIDKI